MDRGPFVDGMFGGGRLACIESIVSSLRGLCATAVVHCRHLHLCPVIVCCYYQWPAVTELFLRYTRDEINKRGSWNETALHLAVARRDIQSARLLLRHELIGVSARFLHGRTPLHIAVASRYLPAVQALCRHENIEINAEDVIGFTALRLLLNGELSKVTLDLLRPILRHPGIDMNAADDDGSTSAKLLIELAIDKYSNARCPCDTTASPGSAVTDCPRCAFIRLFIEVPHLKITRSCLEAVAVRGSCELAQLVLAREDLDANVELSHGTSMSTTAAHILRLAHEGQMCLVAARSPVQTLRGIERGFRLILRHATVDVNLKDRRWHTVLDWLDFYASHQVPFLDRDVSSILQFDRCTYIPGEVQGYDNIGTEFDSPPADSGMPLPDVYFANLAENARDRGALTSLRVHADTWDALSAELQRDLYSWTGKTAPMRNIPPEVQDDVPPTFNSLDLQLGSGDPSCDLMTPEFGETGLLRFPSSPLFELFPEEDEPSLSPAIVHIHSLRTARSHPTIRT